MKRILSLLLAALLAVLLPASADGIPPAYTARTKNSTEYFNTLVTLRIYDDFSDPANVARADALWQDVKAVLRELDGLLSTSIETSDVARFNRAGRGEEVPVSETTAEVFLLARRMWEETGGLYDPTVFPLVDLWGFSPRFHTGQGGAMPYDRPQENGSRALPGEEYIEGFLRLVGLEGIELRGGPGDRRLVKTTPPVEIGGARYEAMIDLGGIAKGWAADRVDEMLREGGFRYAMFSCGASSMTLRECASSAAKESGDPRFTLAIRAPRPGESDTGSYAEVPVADRALSSSGDYDSYYLVDGVRYCHIISPKTGRPLNVPPEESAICTVTLLSGSAAEDDAYTTALCLMGPEGASAFIREKLPDRWAAMVVLRAEGEKYGVITNIPDLRLTDGAYELIGE